MGWVTRLSKIKMSAFEFEAVHFLLINFTLVVQILIWILDLDLLMSYEAGSVWQMHLTPNAEQIAFWCDHVTPVFHHHICFPFAPRPSSRCLFLPIVVICSQATTGFVYDYMNEWPGKGLVVEIPVHTIANWSLWLSLPSQPILVRSSSFSAALNFP